MALTAEIGSTSSAVVYKEVKAWIAKQEAFEAQYNQPAPLTDAQRMALEVLRLSTGTPSPPLSPPQTVAPAAPAAPELNYVGILTAKLIKRQEYHQKRNQSQDLRFSDEASGELPHGVIGRVCRVKIADHSFADGSAGIVHFPAKGFGLNDDGSLPRFKSKKDAKRFAAQCAVEWLAAQGLLAPHPQASSPPPKRQKVTVPPESGRTSEAAMTIPSAPSVPEQVATLCHLLNFPAPRYDIVLNAQNTYNGRALFDDCGDAELLSLNGASYVEGIPGKDAAKKAVAAKVLEKLREIEAGREAQLHGLMAQLNDLVEQGSQKGNEDDF